MPAEDLRAIERSDSVRSLLTIRFHGGLVGVLLPVALIAVDFLALGEGCLRVRDSLSAYYHSGARDVFVIGLGIVGFLLFSYKLDRRSVANAASTVAGVAAVLVAVFPTKLPGPVSVGECGAGSALPLPTPLQQRLPFDTSVVHLSAAAVVFGMFVLMCVLTALHDRRNPFLRPAVAPAGSGRLTRLLAQVSNRLDWRFHLGCALTIVVIGGLCLLASWTRTTLPLHFGPLWVAEVVGIFAFSASWFVKGLDDMFFRREPWSRREMSDIRMAVARGESLTVAPGDGDGPPAGESAVRELRYLV